jgi:hypothetical protein
MTSVTGLSTDESVTLHSKKEVSYTEQGKVIVPPQDILILTLTYELDSELADNFGTDGHALDIEIILNRL